MSRITLDPLLVVGSISIDTIESTGASAEGVLGGSAAYAAIAAREVRPSIISAVGDDFFIAHRRAASLLEGKEISLDGLQVVGGALTLRWSARYETPDSDAEMLSAELGAFEHFRPVLGEAHAKSRVIVLANLPPSLQRMALDQIQAPRVVISDTMARWIDQDPDGVIDIVRCADIALMTEAEACLLTGLTDADDAAGELLGRGANNLIVKSGARGATLWTSQHRYKVPAYAQAQPVDPTGAGDAFAGAMAAHFSFGARELNTTQLIEASARGSATASICVEGFGPAELARAEHHEIERRAATILERVEPVAR